MNADDHLNRYLPDFDASGIREHLQQSSKDELIEMLIVAYKNARVMAMQADIFDNKLSRIRQITEESTALPALDQPPPNFPK